MRSAVTDAQHTTGKEFDNTVRVMASKKADSACTELANEGMPAAGSESAPRQSLVRESTQEAGQTHARRGTNTATSSTCLPL